MSVDKCAYALKLQAGGTEFYLLEPNSFHAIRNRDLLLTVLSHTVGKYCFKLQAYVDVD